MDFSKIKWNKGEVQLTWTTEKGKDAVRHELTSADLPAPELEGAFNALIAPVLKLLELPPEYRTGMRAVSVSITRQIDDNRGAVVTCLKEIDGATSPLVLNTPYVPELPNGEGGPSMPGDLRDAIYEVEVQAERYANGQRAQQEMFAESTGS